MMVELLEGMRRVTLEASTLVLSHYGRTTAELKADRSTVTKADREVERLLQDRLHELLPKAAFIGEETTGDPHALALARQSEWVWVVDPIDGTALFSQGLDNFAVAVGLLKDGQPFAGMVAMPAMDHLYSAMRGCGAFHTVRGHTRRIAVATEEPPLDRAFVCLSRNAHRYLEVRYAGRVLAFGSTAYNFVLVAGGSVIGAVGRSHVWDHVASAAIIIEAGGVIRRHDGTEIDWVEALDGKRFAPPLVAAPPALWDRIIKGVRLRQPLTGPFQHRVNSRAALQAFLDGPALVAEGDVLLGRYEGTQTAIMAHPPDTESDLSFARFVAAIGAAKRAIKVDMKDPKALARVEAILQEARFPQDRLIVNADVCVGPGAAPVVLTIDDLVDVRAAFPRATISVSATTRPDAGPYTPEHIAALQEAAAQIGGRVTVALRVSIVREDPGVLHAFKDTHLTFWNGPETSESAELVAWLGAQRPAAFLDLTWLPGGAA